AARYERPGHLAREERGRRVRGEDLIDDAVAVHHAGLAEERDLLRVRTRLVEDADLRRRLVAVGEAPAGERPRRGLHVVLGVVADAQREELHELAGVVL